MLKVLKRIVQDVTTSENLVSALNILVEHVSSAIYAEAVSVFLIDTKHRDYVLIATKGLNKDAESVVRIPMDRGVIGLIGRREEPINMDDASEHPDFYYNPLLKEEHLHAFLGVPIIQHRKLYGALIAQQSAQRCFDDAEEAFLITLAAQLGGMIAHAEATGDLARLTEPPQIGPAKTEHVPIALKGISSVPGIAIGTAIVIYPPADIDAVPKHFVDDVESEVSIFLQALQAARDNMNRISRRIKSSISDEEHALFDVYQSILDQDNLETQVITEIRNEQLGAQAALAMVIKKHIQQFEDMHDPYLRERASDFRDIGRRILAELQSSQQEEIEYPKRTILVGEEISAATLAEVPVGHLAGIVSATGSANSHMAILARSLCIPTVMGVRGLKLDQVSRRALIVDGDNCELFISPTKMLLAEYKQLIQKEDELNLGLVNLRDKPAETLDQHRVGLLVNIGLAMDSGMSMSVGAEGVGLYRSEIPFMSRDRFPSEDEQHIIYRQTLKAFAPRPVTMRTLDIGGDKVLPYFPIQETNPYLGWRGIRVTLDHPDVFLLQVRAMMRANEGLHNLRIMLPMITTLSEIDEAAYLIDQAYAELLEEGCHIEKPALGVMIEVPAAACQAKELAKRVEFLSVGTNDLTQYLLAIDRNNTRVANLYDPLHPAMLTTLIRIIEGGHAGGAKVSVCGEMASDPLGALLLLAMGFDSFSMNSASLPRIKWLIRSFTLTHARKILADVLELEHPTEIRLHLQRCLEEQGLGDLVRTGK